MKYNKRYLLVVFSPGTRGLCCWAASTLISYIAVSSRVGAATVVINV